MVTHTQPVSLNFCPTKGGWRVASQGLCLFLALLSAPLSAVSVNPDGSYNYEIPVEAPAGIGTSENNPGLKPDLKIHYNSNLPNGYLGIGWEISGLSRISRINAGKGITYTTTDTFSGSGGRLVQISANPLKYRFYEDNGSVIEALGTCGTGPCSFIATDVNGNKTFYGDTLASRAIAQSRAEVRVWAISKMQDIHGNFYTVDYLQNNGEIYPQKIVYTQGAGITRFHSIELEYENRPDIELSYAQSVRVQTIFRLKNVFVKANMTDVRLFDLFLGQLIFRYQFNYGSSPDTGRSLLTSIIPVDYSYALGTSQRAPIQFAWGTSAGNLSTACQSSSLGGCGVWSTNTTSWPAFYPGDFNGDGKTDFLVGNNVPGNEGRFVYLSNGDGTFTTACQSSSLGGCGIWSTNTTSWPAFHAGDFNGDGKTDFLAGNNVPGNENRFVYLSNGDGTFTRACESASLGGCGIWSTNTTSWPAFHSGDFNGDGRTDFLAGNNVPGNENRFVYLSNGDGTFTRACESSSLGGCGIWSTNTTSWPAFHSGDFNGDGKTDFLAGNNVPGNENRFVYLSNGDGTFTRACESSSLGGCGVWSTNTSSWPAFYSGDFNGDGKTDFLAGNSVPGNESRFVYLSNGDGTFTRACESSSLGGCGVWSTNASSWPAFYSGDFNGDGKTDFLAGNSVPGNESRFIYLSNGDGTFKTACESSSLGGCGVWSTNKTSWPAFHAGDFNGDGKIDFLAGNNVSGNEGRFVFLSSSQRSLLTSVTTSLGATTSISYAPAPQVPGAIQPNSTSCGADCGRSLAAPLYLVQSVTTTDGRGNSYLKTYNYSDLRMHTGAVPDDIMNRHFLGFATFSETDTVTGIRTTTTYDQRYYFAFREIGKRQYAGNNTLMAEKLTTYNAQGLTSYGTKRVLPVSETTKTYEHGVHINADVTKTYSYDADFNQTGIIESGPGMDTVDTQNTFTQDSANPTVWRKTEEKIFVAGVLSKDTKWVWASADPAIAMQHVVREEKYLNTNNSWVATQYAYDANGNITQITDPLGNVTTREYDSDYHTFNTKVTDALGRVSTVTHDIWGNPLTETDANGNMQTKQYDIRSRLSRVIDPGVITYTKEIYFVNEGNPTTQYMEVRYKDDSSTGYRYERSYFDGLDRIYKEVKKGYVDGASSTAYEIITEHEFRSDGKNLTRESKPYVGGLQTPLYVQYTYDDFNRVLQKSNPDGSVVGIAYNGNVQTATDDNGNTERVVHDGRGRVTEREQRDATATLISRVTYEYHGLNDQNVHHNLADAAKSRLQMMVYDTLGRTTHVKEASQAYFTANSNYSVTYFKTYDANGNLLAETQPNGTIVTNAYDALNRILRRQVTGETDITYEYDNSSVANSKGRLTKVTDQAGSTRFGYDARGNVISWVSERTIGGNTVNVAFAAEYNEQKQIKKLTYPDGSFVNQLYSDAGYLHQVRLALPGAVFGSPMVTYEGPDANQQFIRRTGNNVLEKIGYDPASHRPTSLETILADNTTIRKFNYAYDGNGNTLSITDILNGQKTETFTYDGLNRVASAVGPYGSKSYAHDAVGNLISKDNTTQQYNDTNHPYAVTQGSEGIYSYDANGNLNSRLGRDYASNTNNQLKEIKLGSAVKQNFVYDYSNTRAIKRREDGTEVFYFGGLKNYGALYEIATLAGGQPQHTKYVYGLNSDRAAQITTPNANLVAYYANSNYVLASMQSWKSVQGIAMKIGYTFNGYAMEYKKAGRGIKTFGLVACFFILSGFLYFRIFHGKENRYLQHGRPAYYASPLVLVSFVWIYGIGCAATPSSPSDPLPASGSTAGVSQIGDAGSDTTTKGFPISGTFFFHPNHIGSVNYITNTAGAVVTEINYQPYGKIDYAHSSGPDIVRYKYTGQEEDPESGLYNYNARMYNPESGGFTSADTVIPGDGERAMGFNRYAGMEGNPVRFNDPSGHEICGYGTWCSTAPGYNFAGPNRRAEYDQPGTTSLDEVAKVHDMEGAKLFPFGDSKEERYKNIGKDAKFLAVGGAKIFSGYALGENISKAKEQQPDNIGGWYAAILIGIFYTALDLMVYGVAFVLFLTNIVWTFMANLVESYVAGWSKIMSGNFKEWWDDIWDW